MKKRFIPLFIIIFNKIAYTGSWLTALEYNFNSNAEIIGGVWFPVRGQNTSHFQPMFSQLTHSGN